MSAVRTLGLRARLSIALVAVALLAVATATLLSSRGIDPRLSEAARARLDRSARSTADVAARIYRRDRAWTRGAAFEVEHVALTNGVNATVFTSGGRIVASERDGVEAKPPAPAGETAAAPVVVGGRNVGTVRVAPVSGSLLTPEEVNLRDSLGRLHMVAAVIAAAAALVVALLLAQTLSRPLRRIRAGAELIERGDLDARVPPGGDREVRAVAHALNRLAETLEHEEEVRKESVADLAHELRTPVGGLLSRIEAALDGVLADGQRNLEAMREEALRLTRLLDDLDRLAAAERPGLLLDKRPVDLAAVGERAAEQLGPAFAEKQIELETDLGEAWVDGDQDRLLQIATNLLSNAARYTEPGGRARLSVRRRERSVVMEVDDTGSGIEPGDLAHIFKRFWRADKSRSRATGGAGIGLAIVRELVIAHNGRIDVESVPGVGSRFRVSLPAAAGRAHAGDGREGPARHMRSEARQQAQASARDG
jgi:two-component system sensor histidine kinase BaeS